MIVDGVRRDKRRKRESDEAIEAMQNLAGDADLDAQSGLIEVDRSDAQHPVVRFRLDRLKIPDSSEKDADTAADEPFKYTEIEDSKYLANCQFFFGGELHTLADVPVQANKTYYLNIVGAQDASTGDMTWTYAVSDAAATGGHLHMAIPLIETGADCRPVKDFRAASLSYVLPNRPFLWNNTLLGHIFADDDIDIGTKEIEGGRGITVTDDGETVTISVDVELVAGPGIVINSGAVAVNPDTHSIDITGGSGNGRKVQLAGFGAPGSNAADMTLGRALAQTAGANVRYALVAIPYNGVYALKYMPLDALAIDAEADSGLEVISTTDTGGRPVLRIDWAGRQVSDAVALSDLIVYGSDGIAETAVRVPSTGDVEIPGVKGGKGVTVTSDDGGATRRIDADVADVQSDSEEIEVTRDEDGVVHISLSGEGGSGGGSSSAYTGSMKVCSGMSYNTTTHKFVATFQTFQINNGLVMDNPVNSTENIFTAVEETT